MFLFFSTSGAVNRVNISASTVVEFIFVPKENPPLLLTWLNLPRGGGWSVVNSRRGRDGEGAAKGGWVETPKRTPFNGSPWMEEGGWEDGDGLRKLRSSALGN